MATENLTTYTEVDPNSRVTKTADRVTSAGIIRNESAYLYDDKDAGHFNGDFEHLIDVKVTACDSAAQGGFLAFWGLYNLVGDRVDAYGTDALAVYWINDASTNYIYMHGRYNEGASSSERYESTLNTAYYLTIKRVGSTTTCKIYSDVARESLLATLTSTPGGVSSLRYVYAMQSYTTAGDTAISGYAENLDLQEGVIHEGAATLSGAGTLANIGSLIKKGISALQGAATVAIIASLILTSAAPLGGEGTLTTEAHVIRADSATLSGEGQLTTTAEVATIHEGSAILEGIGSLSTAAHLIKTDSAALSGEGALATEAHLTRTGTAALSGAGSLATIGSVITLYEYYNTGDDGFNSFWTSLWRGQSFTPGITHKITSVKLKLFRDGSPGTITVSIRATSAGKPTGEDLCVGTTDGDTLTTNSNGEWREITLGDGYNLVASTQYAIVVRISGGDSGNKISWRYDSSSPTYTAGAYLDSSDSGSTWGKNDTIDHVFEEWGTWLPGIVEGSASLEGAGSLTTVANLTLTATIASAGEGQLAIVATLFRHGSATLSGQGQIAVIAYLTKTDTATISGEGQLSIVACLVAIGNASLIGEGQLTATGEVVGAAVEGEAVLSGVGTVESIACLITTGVIALQGEGLLSSVGSKLLCASAEAQGEGSLQIAAACIFVGIIETTGEGSLTATAVILLYGEATLTGEGSLSIVAFIFLEIEPALPYTVELRDGSGNLVAILENARDISYAQVINAPHSLTFNLPANDSKTANILLSNEIWLRDTQTDTVIRKLKLQRKMDARK